MKLNMSRADRIIRFLVVIAICVLLYVEVLKGTLGTIFGILAIIFVITSITGFCPIYRLLKKSTKKESTSMGKGT